MGHQMVFLSFSLRGELYSDVRRKDLLNARQVIEKIRRERRRDLSLPIPFAPYLLYGETIINEDDLDYLRQKIASDIQCVELWVYGPSFSDGISAEVKVAESRGINAVHKTLDL